MSYIDKVSVDGLVYNVQDTNTKVKVENVNKDLKALEEVVDGVNTKVDSFNSTIGSEELTTTSNTIKGAINELDSAIAEIGEGASGGSFIRRSIPFPNLTVNLASGGSMDVNMVTDLGYIELTRWCTLLIDNTLYIPDGCVFVQTELIPSNGDGRSQIKGKLYNISGSDINGGLFSPRMTGICSQ